jgi:hypothetical protein
MSLVVADASIRSSQTGQPELTRAVECPALYQALDE